MYRDDLNDPDNYLMISGIQHFCFCRRQWALIHVEQQWEDNWRTVSGQLIHKRVHNDEIYEKRVDGFILRGLRVSSAMLHLSGICDAVEFVRDDKGYAVKGHGDLWRIIPVEYKHGKTRDDEADQIQLCAQTIALEEMFPSEIPFGFIYHHETRRRERVVIDEALRDKTIKMANEMMDLYINQITPLQEKSNHCLSCSLSDICMPRIKGLNPSQYIQNMMGE